MKILDIKDTDRFSLDPEFVAEFEGKEPAWGPVGLVTYKRTYARPLPDGGTEDYWQTCQRVVEGVYTIQKWHCHRNHLPWSDRKAQRSAQEMFRLMWDFKFLPPGRGLWMMGTPYIEENGGAALNNCAFVSTEHINEDFSDPFTFLMDMSMLGVGVGGDVRGAGKVTIQKPQWDPTGYAHVVEDSRAGWIDLIRRVLDSYAGADTYPAHIDYSKVRPAGEPIKSFGGVAAGPEPLMECVTAIGRILDPLVGKKITGEAIVDLFNVIGVCVVSGNVRRSAEIMLGEAGDEAFMDLKQSDHSYDACPNNLPRLHPAQPRCPQHAHRWASNNSVIAEIGSDYSGIAERIVDNGEPGVFWLDTAREYGRMKDPANGRDRLVVGTNPCSEQSLESFELCCLVETFPSRHETFYEYKRTLKFAYLYAKTVTLIPTHDVNTNAVMARNRRIGTSQSGIVESFARHGRREHFQWCDEGYAYLQDLDALYSNWLAIPRSIKITSVKPSGTVSLLPGVTPGIHYEHAEYYFRTIRMAKNHPMLKSLRKAGYRIEDDVADTLNKTAVVYFPVHIEYFDRSKADVSMWEQLENAAQMQHFWADNQVSITVTFKPEEAADIGRALELYEGRLKSVSFLPLVEHGYAQAPYQTITADEYAKAAAKLKPIKFGDDTHDSMDLWCDGDACLIPGAEGQQPIMEVV